MTEATVARIDEALAGALPPGTLFAVGGRVRDEVRSVVEGAAFPAKDLDYVATGIGLDDLRERLSRVGRTDVVGVSFAVVKCDVGGVTVDVALPRREHSTGVGHRDFVVESGAEVTLEEDLARRDFRMNMLARAIPSGALVDPYGGIADIRARRVDILAERAFAEDPLRILRAVQFAARFGYTLTARTFAAMRDAATVVGTVSAERVRDELSKLLALAPAPGRGIDLMRETGVLEFVLPELLEGVGVEQNVFHAYDVFRHNLETLDAAPVGDITVRLAALLHDVGKPRTKDGPHFYRHEIVGAEMAGAALERLRFSNDERTAVVRLIRNHMYVADPEMSDATMRRFIRRIGVDLIDRQFALRHADIVGSGLPKRGDANERFEARVAAMLAGRPALGVGDLAIGGAEVIRVLVECGMLPPGSRGSPMVGDILRGLLDRVVDDPALNESGRLAEVARELARAGTPLRADDSSPS